MVQSMMVMRRIFPPFCTVSWWWDCIFSTFSLTLAAHPHPSKQFHGDETASSQSSASLWQHVPTLLHNIMVMRLHLPNHQPPSGSTPPPPTLLHSIMLSWWVEFLHLTINKDSCRYRHPYWHRYLWFTYPDRNLSEAMWSVNSLTDWYICRSTSWASHSHVTEQTVKRPPMLQCNFL